MRAGESTFGAKVAIELGDGLGARLRPAAQIDPPGSNAKARRPLDPSDCPEKERRAQQRAAL